ncbi:hypothetical protein QBC41DRAFT_302373 [Cercophora samala]|uniref:Uncharacterized protein n=1 Tax=Cercophora samala TaxID=330535 RepID=A0AA40DC16_9PEZI|nr:hypothetical protein QBC41DRAFT_302373 [Cercophora samala]
MADVRDIYDTIRSISRNKTRISDAHAIYRQRSSRLRALLSMVSRRHSFTTETVTDVMVGPARPGDFSPLVAGWVYRHLWDLRHSNSIVQEVVDPREHVNLRYSMDQLRSWTNTIRRPGVCQQKLEEIARKVNGIPQELQARLCKINSEGAKLQQIIDKIENTPGGVEVATLIEASDEGSSAEED